MKITNEFTVHTPIDRAWQVLTDLEGIAPCMPGAQLTGVEGDVYRGKVKVKVGPVISEFAGTARFTERDDTAYRAVIDAKGRDARSAGNAAALVTAVLAPAGESTTVSVDTDLKISGKLAQFGSGMIKEVSGKLLAQFVANLEAKLATDAASAAPQSKIPPASASPVPTPAPPAPSTPATPAADAPVTAPAAGSVPTPGAPIDADPAPAPVVAIADPSASPAAAFLAAAKPASEPAASSSREFVATEEPEPLDLLSVAGGSVYKRVVPLAVAVLVAGAVIAWLVARR
ncbi:SRPBCC family protein [Paractinoplanes durhamensis]|uniref:SRPBCC family protein n=1 Tax=Paractinoplanes durhamensis TaxID=113563 RepID=UPI0031D51432